MHVEYGKVTRSSIIPVRASFGNEGFLLQNQTAVHRMKIIRHPENISMALEKTACV